MNEQILYKFLRYLLLAAILYLILRYTPYVNLSVQQALIITVILIILCIILEYIYTLVYPPYNNPEGFKQKPCDTCKPKDSVNELNNTGQKCRMVCDGIKVGNDIPMTNQPIKNETETKNEVKHEHEKEKSKNTTIHIEHETQNTPEEDLLCANHNQPPTGSQYQNQNSDYGYSFVQPGKWINLNSDCKCLCKTD